MTVLLGVNQGRDIVSLSFFSAVPRHVGQKKTAPDTIRLPSEDGGYMGMRPMLYVHRLTGGQTLLVFSGSVFAEGNGELHLLSVSLDRHRHGISRVVTADYG